MKLTTFVAEENNLSRIYCHACNQLIIKAALQIQFLDSSGRKCFYHLKCYTPSLKQYIRPKDIEVSLNQSNCLVFSNWLSEWNKNYVPLDPVPLPPKFETKTVKSNATSHKRMLLECFKYLKVEEIVLSIAIVSKEFYHVSWEIELWKCLLERDYAMKCDGNYRRNYVIEFNSRCIECKKKPDYENFYRCPLILKTICVYCRNDQKFKLICKSFIKREFGVQPKKLEIPFGESSANKKVNYRCIVIKALEKFRTKNKLMVLVNITAFVSSDSPFFQLIFGINVLEMEKEVGKLASKGSSVNRMLKKTKAFLSIFNFIRTGVSEPSYSAILSELKSINSQRGFLLWRISLIEELLYIFLKWKI
jgi:hypothetical protein